MNKVLFTGFFLLVSLFSLAQIRVEAENYTAMSGVSVENGWGDGGGQNIYPIDQGDWMEYTIHPTVTGIHTLIFRFGTVSTGAQFKVKKQDGTVLATVNLSNTGDYQYFRSIAANVTLTAGEQTIRIESTASPKWTFNWFEYSNGYKMEAELYSSMNGVALEGTTDAGGGQDVAYIDAGDWMDYPVNIAAAGTYTAKFRVASPQNNVQLQIKNSGGSVLATLNVPNTNGWQTWQTVDTTLSLSAGQQTLRVYATTGGWNFNWWALLPASNPAPVVNAGSDQTITLPTSTVTLSGSATDANGTISSYAWTKVSGPNNPTFSNAASATAIVSGLVQGTYVFKLTATDNEGSPGFDDVTITVNAASAGANWYTTGNNGIDTTLHFIGTNDNQPLIFKTNNIKQARLTTDGVLEVKKLRVTQGGWADFVFDSSYRLRPIKELELFINNNKHLPDVPSEKEVVSNGIDVGNNQAVLLRKIEELALYIIELNKKAEATEKKIEAQQKKIEALEAKN
jgi:hypothetical protein